MLRAQFKGLPLSFIVAVGSTTLDELRDFLGIPIDLTVEQNVVVKID